MVPEKIDSSLKNGSASSYKPNLIGTFDCNLDGLNRVFPVSPSVVWTSRTATSSGLTLWYELQKYSITYCNITDLVDFNDYRVV